MLHEKSTKNCKEEYLFRGFPKSAILDDILARLNESVVTTKSGNEVPNFGKFCMVII